MNDLIETTERPIMTRIVFHMALILCITALLSVSFAEDNKLKSTEKVQEPDSAAVENPEVAAEVVFASYLHGTRRCATCRKLEAYSEEALKTAFQDELNDSTLIWRTINYDQKENEHYLKDYGLYTKALILSRVRDGSETEWENLTEIWELVGDKDEFLKYVREETRAFMDKDTD
jgi:hypothetical protein